MTPTEFCYWLQGALKMRESSYLSTEKVALIEEKLNAALTPPTSLKIPINPSLFKGAPMWGGIPTVGPEE